MDYTSSEMANQMEQTQLESQTQNDKGKGKKDRGINWGIIEDLSLCKGWLAISEDGIISTDQQQSAFWKRVYGFFLEDFGPSTCRDAKKLQTRWSKHLLPMITKFGAIYEQLDNNKPSGFTDQNVYNEACGAFFKLYKKDWRWNACYNILKDSPKWRRASSSSVNEIAPRAKRSTKRSSDGEPKTPGTSSTPTSSVNFSQNPEVVPELVVPEVVVAERPMGRKELKDRRRKEKESASQNLSSSNAAISNLMSSFEKRASQRDREFLKKMEMKREIEMQKMQMKADYFQKAQESKILSTSLETVPQEYRAVFKARQDAIAASWQQTQPPFGIPQPSYVQQPSFGMPQPSYVQQPSFGMPQPPYVPQPPFGMPQPSYVMPQPSYPQPYVMPQPSYPPPYPQVGTPGSAVGSNVGDARSTSDESDEGDEC